MNSKSNIVISAADGCGKPSSIRSMDNLPSRDHKGAEYKESFMFSNRSTISRGCSLAAAALAATALVGMAASAGTAQAEVIYGVQFISSENTPPPPDYNGTALTAEQTAGLIPQDNFNVLTNTNPNEGNSAAGYSAGPVTLNDNTGSNAAGVTFSWLDFNEWHTNTAGGGGTVNSSGTYVPPTPQNGPTGALLSGIRASAKTTPCFLTASRVYSKVSMD